MRVKIPKNPILWFIGVCTMTLFVLIAIVVYDPVVPFTRKNISELITGKPSNQPEMSVDPEVDFKKSVESGSKVSIIASDGKFDLRYYPSTKIYTVSVFDLNAKKDIMKEVDSLLLSVGKDPAKAKIQWCYQKKVKDLYIWDCTTRP